MKKILLSCLALLSISYSNAQTLTQANHAPAYLNIDYATVQCDTVAPGASGIGSVWSYTPVMHSSISNTYVTVFAANPAYPAADVAVSSGTASIAYYKASSTGLNYYGGNISANGIAVNLNYATPAKFAQYPFTAISTLTSAVGGSLTVLGNNGTFTGLCTVTADATGTLTLVGRSFKDIIRLTTSQVLNGTIPVIGSVNITQFNYDFYSPSASKAPVFSISTSTVSSVLGGTSTQTFVTVLKDYLTVGVNENSKEAIEISVFPNPSNSVINFNTTSLNASKIIAYDITGKVVVSENFENGKIKLDVSNLISGIYLYTVIDKNNQTLKSGKFNVTK